MTDRQRAEDEPELKGHDSIMSGHVDSDLPKQEITVLLVATTMSLASAIILAYLIKVIV